MVMERDTPHGTNARARVFKNREKKREKKEMHEIFGIRVRVSKNLLNMDTFHACMKRLLVFPRCVDKRSIYRRAFKALGHITKREIERSFMCFQPSPSHVLLYTPMPFSKEKWKNLSSSFIQTDHHHLVASRFLRF